MRRIDRFIALNIVGTMSGVVFVFFCLIALGESLDSWRLSELAKERGTEIAVLSVIANSARWSIRTLPVTVMIGGIVALINLKRHGALVVMSASGLSIWQILRGPVVAIAIAGTLIALVADTEITRLSRFIEPAPQVAGASVGASNEIWLEQRSDSGRFVVTAGRALAGATSLADVTVFLGRDFDLRRIVAEQAELRSGLWVFSKARLITANGKGEVLDHFFLETDATIADLRLRLTSASDLTVFELGEALGTGLTDPALLAAAATRFSRLAALPLMLVGTLLIAFAFTAGYRRTGSYGGTVIYGIVLGFVMFVVNEMAEQAGSAGVLAPDIAAWGPAVVTVVIGLTVLLYREDGRA
ncbi:MAG: LptF/LptG family permease [Alphaproteobacteria bacterium]|nr:LptF/LptG family permease [Alphaproteobacteria bacterium]